MLRRSFSIDTHAQTYRNVGFASHGCLGTTGLEVRLLSNGTENHRFEGVHGCWILKMVFRLKAFEAKRKGTRKLDFVDGDWKIMTPNVTVAPQNT